MLRALFRGFPVRFVFAPRHKTSRHRKSTSAKHEARRQAHHALLFAVPDARCRAASLRQLASNGTGNIEVVSCQPAALSCDFRMKE